jgi:hypothetical protein
MDARSASNMRSMSDKAGAKGGVAAEAGMGSSTAAGAPDARTESAAAMPLGTLVRGIFPKVDLPPRQGGRKYCAAAAGGGPGWEPPALSPCGPCRGRSRFLANPGAAARELTRCSRRVPAASRWTEPKWPERSGATRGRLYRRGGAGFFSTSRLFTAS